jgi:hypothetical protein
MTLPRWGVLHRVAELEVEGFDGDVLPHGNGRTVCGRTGYLSMPGFVSRMGLPRCAYCCSRLGIPRGDGHPYNAGILEPGCEGPEGPV